MSDPRDDQFSSIHLHAFSLVLGRAQLFELRTKKWMSPRTTLVSTEQGFMQDFELEGGGGEEDGSRMIVVCEMRAFLLGGSGGMPPQEKF